MSSSRQVPARTVRPVALFSHKRNRVKSLHSDRDDKFLSLRAVQRENEALSKLSASENRTRVHLEEQEDQLLSVPEAKNLKQECRREFADSNTRELNSQIQSQRMEIDHTNTWYEQSRRKQARLHEELAGRERGLQETHIKSHPFHE